MLAINIAKKYLKSNGTIVFRALLCSHFGTDNKAKKSAKVAFVNDVDRKFTSNNLVTQVQSEKFNIYV